VQLLKKENIEFQVIEYLKNPLSKKEVLSLSKKLGIPPSGFIRKREPDFKQNNLNKDIEDNEKIAEAISLFPKIMERPIAVIGECAVIGRPPEKVLSLWIQESK
jgi:arsenate reductase|tara:strand:+ start:53 stop:364 length:312 start_codon:yes stop_codon:yes gene_type:complete